MRRLAFQSALAAANQRWCSFLAANETSKAAPAHESNHHTRTKYTMPRVIPLTSADIRDVPRLNKRFLGTINDRSFIDRTGIKCEVPPLSEENDTAVLHAMSNALQKLCPSISSFVFDLGVPIAVEQVAELFIPMLVYVEDAILGRKSCDSVLVLDSIESATTENPGYLFHQRRLTTEAAACNANIVKEWYTSENLTEIPPQMTSKVFVVDNYAFDRYHDLILKCFAEGGKSAGLFVAVDDDGRAYVMPGTTEFFLRRIYPCIRKDSFKPLYRVCSSAGWTGFARSKTADGVIIQAYFDYMSASLEGLVPLEWERSFDNANAETTQVMRCKEDYILPSTNELTRLATPRAEAGPSTKLVEKTKLSLGNSAVATAPFTLEESSPLHKLYNEIVIPQANRMQERGLSTFVAYLQSERSLLARFDELTTFQLIALATRLSTPSFVLEVLAKCPSKRANDPINHPLPSWCTPMYSGYFVAGDDMQGIVDMHVREAVKTILTFDKSESDDDSLRNASNELKRMLFKHYAFLPDLHAQVLLCTFRFMQKHEQLHRALKKSIVAGSDARVKGSRIKEITGNVSNTLTELEYCIDTNLMRIPTMPLTKGRIRPTEDPEGLKLTKANMLYQYWYLDWLSSHC